MSPLTAEHREFYVENGYLLVSGLIPDDVAARAEAAMWRILEADPNRSETWTGGGHRSLNDPEIVAVYTPEFIAAAEELAGESGLHAPKSALAINIFPSPGEWSWPRPHIDHAIKEHGHRTFPRAFRVATMTFLNDVAPHGGGTIVWPGGHRKLREIAEADPERYEMMWALNQELDRAGLGEPVELTPRRGDALFYQYLCPHSGSANRSDRPRLALNMKW